MNKALVYVVTATVLGLCLTLVPLLVLKENSSQQFLYNPENLRFNDLIPQRANNLPPLYSLSDFEALGICFTLAFIAYLLFKFKLSY